MNAKFIRQSIVAACAVAASTGVLAHEEPETGPYHWLEHLGEQKSPAMGLSGATRRDCEPAAKPAAAQPKSAAQGDEAPVKGYGRGR